jgi:hypothetical protein
MIVIDNQHTDTLLGWHGIKHVDMAGWPPKSFNDLTRRMCLAFINIAHFLYRFVSGMQQQWPPGGL